jgi:Peptidase family M48
LTQFISRRQEFRSDEIACHMAGSEALITGLENIHKSDVALDSYWQTEVLPVIAGGYQPPLADGFGKFMTAPDIARAASCSLQEQLKSDHTDPFDTHPPLCARIRRARVIGIATPQADNQPAISLFNDLKSLEANLLQKILPNLAIAELKPMAWETAGSEVFVPIWRKQIAEFSPLLSEKTVASIPECLCAVADKILNPPGMLLNRAQREAEAAGLLVSAFTLSLLDHGWNLYIQPGHFYLTRGDSKLEPWSMMDGLRSGKLSALDWSTLCFNTEIGDWSLGPTSSAAVAHTPAV